MARDCAEEWKPIVPSDWPERDRSAWAKATREPDPLDLAPARAAHLRLCTRRQYERGYGCWLKWLLTNDRLADIAPGERATQEAVKTYYQAMLEHGYAGYTIADRLVALAQVLKSIDPDRDYGWISLAARRIHRETCPAKDIGGSLRPSDELFQLGLELMNAATEERFRKPFDRALLYRDGLMIALLAKRPVRVGNLASIEIGDHLRQVGEGWRLSFQGHEVKNHRPFACGWPDDLEHALGYYLAEIRPLLLRENEERGHRALWISSVTGRPMRPGDILVRIKHWTKERFGRSMTPHHFRHAAATTMAINSPEDVAEIAAILGHSRSRTSDEHYNLATSLEAGERCQKDLTKRRQHLGVRKGPPIGKLPLLGLLGDGDGDNEETDEQG